MDEIMNVLWNLKKEEKNDYRLMQDCKNLYDRVEDIYEKERGNVFLKIADIDYKSPHFQANDTFFNVVLKSLDEMVEICEMHKDRHQFYSLCDKAICHLQFID